MSCHAISSSAIHCGALRNPPACHLHHDDSDRPTICTRMGGDMCALWMFVGKALDFYTELRPTASQVQPQREIVPTARVRRRR
jgi:hypothetical protein